MYRKIILIGVLILLSATLVANVFPPEIRLAGYHKVSGNKVTYFNIPKSPIFSYEKPYVNNLLKADTQIDIDFDKMKVVYKTTYRNIKVMPDLYVGFDSYFNKLWQNTLTDNITTNSIDYILSEDRQVDTGIIPEITIKIPKEAIPKGMRSILGDEQGRLNLDGSQKLSITGTSTKRETNLVYEGKDNTNFDMEMKQDLDLRLRGTIGSKISVDLKHNSNTDENLFDPNNIHIEYDGDDDEIVQKVEAGNISLSLSGSKYASTSISSQGLFGVKGEIKVGDLSVQAIFSEEEGQKNKQKYTGNSQQESSIIGSKNYANRTHYFVEPMQRLFELYTQEEVEASGLPSGWADNAIKTEDGKWKVNGSLLPQPGTLVVYLDDGIATNDQTITRPGDPIVNEDGIEYYPSFTEQTEENNDYYVDYESGMIVFNKSINKICTIGIAYIDNSGQLVPSNYDAEGDTLHLKLIRIRNQKYTDDPDDQYSKWTYMAKNIYDLGMRGIKSEGFELKVYTVNEDGTENYRVSDDIDHGSRDTLIKYLDLDTNNDDIVDSSDRVIDLTAGYIYYPFIKPFYSLGDTLIYKLDQESVHSDDFSYKMSVKGSISRERINLNQINILEGSVSVKLNGSTLSEGVDYIVDYDMGEISFLNSRAKDPNAEIEIEYEFRSGFSIERKTMAGLRADLAIGDVGNIGTTFVYKSEKVTDEHPEIGNENYNMFLGDIDADIKFNPEFMTKMVDALPLIKTTAESEISLSGEVAFSFFDIYGNNDTKAKEAYIDDMESVLQPFPLGVTRQVWNPASEPQDVGIDKARTYWFKQENVYAGQVYDPETLTDEEENDEINVMAIKMVPDSTATSDRQWGGLMRYIGNEIDFSDMKYIQVLLKAENYAQSPLSQVRMHIDMGDISENFYTYGENGTPILHREDGANGGTLDGDLEAREDVGLDGIPDNAEGDDEDDDYDINAHFKDDQGHQGHQDEYSAVNGTESNGVLDTEDMDENGLLDQLNRYFEYVVEDITDRTQSEYLENDNNGWKLFRIPLNENNIVGQITAPDISKIKYVRIWFEVDETTKVNLVEFEVVGNKYLERPIYNVTLNADDVEVYNVVDTVTINDNDESIAIGVADNQKDNHYISPKGTYKVEQGTQTLEQSLRLDATNLQPNHIGLVRHKENKSTNWLSYNALRYWIYPEMDEEISYNDSIYVVFRAGADSLNYYEIRYKTKPNAYYPRMERSLWKEISLDFSKLTRLKNASPDDADTLFVTEGDYTFIRYKNPTLSSIQELSMGVMIPNGNPGFTGKIYFNDIRVADPNTNVGIAYSIDLRTKFADFLDFTVSYEQKSDNFRKEILRNSQTSYIDQTNFNMSGKVYLHKFLPYDWGYNIPVQVNRTQSWGIPRFKANSDILRKDLEDIYLDKEENKSKSYTAEVTLQKNASKPKWWTKYTLDSTSLSARVTYTEANTPTNIDTTLAYNGTYTYNLSIPREKIGIKIFKNYYWYVIPRTLDNTITLTASDPKSWTFDTTKKEFLPTLNSKKSKYINTTNTVNYDILSDLTSTYRLSTKRDLVYKKYVSDINVGEETEYKQTLDVTYNPNHFPNIYSFSISPQASFNETRRLLNTNTTDNVEEYRFERSGGVKRDTSINFTLKNSDMLKSLSRKFSENSSKKATKKSEDSKDEKVIDKKEKEINTKYEESASSKVKEIGNDAEDVKYDTKYKERVKELQTMLDKGAITKEKMDKELASFEKNYNDNDYSPKPSPKDDIKNGGEDKAGRSSKSSEPTNIFTYISKLKNIVVSFDNNYSTDYSDLNNRPEFMYQLGVPDVVARDSLNSIKNKNTISVNTGIELTRNIDISTGYSYSFETTEANSSSQRESVTFPDISVNVSEFQKWIGIERVLTSSRLSSSYSYSVKKSGDFDWDEPNTVTKELSLSPLINWNGNWLKNVNTTASYGFTNSKTTTDRGAYKSLSERNSNVINGSISYSFTAARGLKLPFMNKRMRLKNELTSSMNFSYNIDKEENKGNENTVVVMDKTKFTLTPTVSYNFSKNIKGGFDLQYSNEKNHKSEESIRIFSTALWIQVKF